MNQRRNALKRPVCPSEKRKNRRHFLTTRRWGGIYLFKAFFPGFLLLTFLLSTLPTFGEKTSYSPSAAPHSPEISPDGSLVTGEETDESSQKGNRSSDETATGKTTAGMGPTSTPSSPSSPPSDPSAVRYLLTRNDSIQEGIPIDRGDNYYLQFFSKKGGVTISKLDIVFIGQKRSDIFDYKRGLISPRNPKEVVQLAEWSGRNRLSAEGIAFLKETLSETTAEESRRMIQKQLDLMEYVERLKENASKRMAENAVREAEKAKERDVETDRLDRFAKRVPDEVSERYFRRIQPILYKRCASSDCHRDGGAETGFSLIRTDRQPSLRKEQWRNLEIVLDYIDLQSPEESPILSHSPIMSGNGRRIYPFGEGQTALKDYSQFLDWVKMTGMKMRDYQPDPNRPFIPTIRERNSGNGTSVSTRSSDGEDFAIVPSTNRQETPFPSERPDQTVPSAWGLTEEEMAELDRILDDDAKDGGLEEETVAGPNSAPPRGKDSWSIQTPPRKKTLSGSPPSSRTGESASEDSDDSSSPNGPESTGESPPTIENFRGIRDEFDPFLFNQKNHPDRFRSSGPSVPNRSGNSSSKNLEDPLPEEEE